MDRYLFVISLLTAITLSAQPRRPAEPVRAQVQLTVRVVDSVTGAGIAGASFVLSDYSRMVGDIYEGVFDSWGEHVVVPRADKDGRAKVMVFENSPMRLGASAPGYPIVVVAAKFQVEQAPLTITIPLEKGSIIVGRITDAASGKPLADVPIRVRKLSFRHGIREFVNAEWVMKTDSDGRNHVDELRPDAYILETNAVPSFEKVKQDMRYGHEFWPGGTGAEQAVPVSVVSGTTADFGTIALKKVSLPVVTIKVAGDCDGHRYSLSLAKTYASEQISWGNAGQIGCGQEAAFKQIPPGLYSVLATQEDMKPPFFPDRFGMATLEVSDAGGSSTVAVHAPVNLNGRVLSKVKETAVRSVFVHLDPIGQRGKDIKMELPEERNVVTAGMGEFQAHAYVPQGGEVYVWANNLPANFYIESLRYNGKAIDGNVFVLDESAPTQNLDIICSGDFGTVAGTLLNTERGVADIVLAPWPNQGGIYPSESRESVADPNGKFTVEKVRPGHYKAVAVLSQDWQLYQEPSRLMDALRGGVDVTVVVGANDVQLETLSGR